MNIIKQLLHRLHAAIVNGAEQNELRTYVAAILDYLETTAERAVEAVGHAPAPEIALDFRPAENTDIVLIDDGPPREHSHPDLAEQEHDMLLCLMKTNGIKIESLATILQIDPQTAQDRVSNLHIAELVS